LENSIKCNKCKAENSTSAKFCYNCGLSLSGKVTTDSATKKSINEKDLNKPFYLNPYFIILIVALLGMIIGTYYNSKLLSKNQPEQVAQTRQSSQEESQPADQHVHPPDTEIIEETARHLEHDPDNPTLNAQMGNLMFDSGKFSEAIGYYEKSLEFEPNNADVMVDLGVCYFNLEDYKKANELFKEALKINSNHVNALYNVGVVSIRLGEMDMLMDAWSKLQKLAPNSPQAVQASQILDEIHNRAQQQN
jgi:cytochrome c-type biogenesis protein CcmH/NrfG